MFDPNIKYTVKPVLSGHSKRRPKIGFQDLLSLNDSVILSIFIKLSYVFKTFVLSIFECPLKTGFTVILYLKSLPHLAFAVGTLALSPSLSVISNMSNLPSDKHVTSRDGMAGFQAMSSRREPGAPFNRAFRKGDTFSLT